MGEKVGINIYLIVFANKTLYKIDDFGGNSFFALLSQLLLQNKEKSNGSYPRELQARQALHGF